MLTKGSFTRDEWDHLLRLLNIMNFSMSSCSHFSFKQKAVMSKRAQESTSKEGSAVAKPRPMNLLSRNLLSAKKTPPQDSSAPNSRENQELNQSYVPPSARKLIRNSNQDPTAFSQERRQDDTLSCSTKKLGRSGESASSASTRKLERGEDIQIGRTTVQVQTLQISEYRHLEKVFKNLRKKLNLAEEAPVVGFEALKTNVLICGYLCRQRWNTNFEELQNLFDITQRLTLDHQAEILDVSPHGRDLH